MNTENLKTENRIKWFFLIIPLLAVVFRYPVLDNDFYFIFATGKSVVENGIPHMDTLSMHTNMKILAQQWLSSVIFYYLYDLFGKAGVFAFSYLVYALICFLTFRTSKLITGNPVISAICTMFICIPTFYWYVVSRPQIITYVILLCEIYMVECYISSQKKRFLFVIPLLSILLINCHAAMWMMMFVFLMPYIVSAIPVKIKSLKYTPCCNIFHLLAVVVVSFAVGFLNPYGTKSMFYLFSSYGQQKLNETINEMQAPSFSSLYGKFYIIFLILMAFIGVVSKKKSFTPRFVFLFAGTLLLSIMHNKSIPYFWLFGGLSFSYFIKDFSIRTILELNIFKKNKRLLPMLMTVLFLLIALVGFMIRNKSIYIASLRLTHIKHLEEVTEILDSKSEDIVLYANFNDGQFFEFKGYHPYIDGRAELFLEDLNEDFDYFSEYCSLRNAETYYRDFVDKYNFNYLVVSKERDQYLYATISRDDDFDELYDSYDIVLYHRK